MKEEIKYISDDGIAFASKLDVENDEAKMNSISRFRDDYAKLYPFTLNVGDIVRLHENHVLYSVCRREVVTLDANKPTFQNVYWLCTFGDIDDDREQAFQYIYENSKDSVSSQADLVITADQANRIHEEFDIFANILCGCHIDELMKAIMAM